MAGGGIALKSISLLLRLIQFGCAAVILSLFSYFLAVLSDHNLHIARYIKAVEGISGAAVLYTILALLLVCCLGGFAFFALIGVLLDLAFVGAFGYLIYATRHGANSCSGTVNTPLGTGNVNSGVSDGKGGFLHLPSLRNACRMNKACFAVAIIGLIFFLLSIPLSLALMKHRKKEKAYGPSPNNGYTAGSPKRKFWQRQPKQTTYAEKNPDALPAHTAPSAVRDSYGTEETAVGHEAAYNKYGTSGVPQQQHVTHAVGNDTAYTKYPAGGVAQQHIVPQQAVGHESTYNNYGTGGVAKQHVPQQTGYTTTTQTHVPHTSHATNIEEYRPYGGGGNVERNTTGTF